MQWSAAVGAAAAADGRRCVRRHDGTAAGVGTRALVQPPNGLSAQLEMSLCPRAHIRIARVRHWLFVRKTGKGRAQSGERAMRGVPCANVCAAEKFCANVSAARLLCLLVARIPAGRFSETERKW